MSMECLEFESTPAELLWLPHLGEGAHWEYYCVKSHNFRTLLVFLMLGFKSKSANLKHDI